MKCCLYLKVIARAAGRTHLKKFREAFVEAGIFSYMVEIFQDEVVAVPDSSKTYAT